MGSAGFRSSLYPAARHHLRLLRDVLGVQPHPAHDAFHGRGALRLFLVHFLAAVGQLKRQLLARVATFRSNR